MSDINFTSASEDTTAPVNSITPDNSPKLNLLEKVYLGTSNIPFPDLKKFRVYSTTDVVNKFLPILLNDIDFFSLYKIRHSGGVDDVPNYHRYSTRSTNIKSGVPFVFSSHSFLPGFTEGVELFMYSKFYIRRESSAVIDSLVSYFGAAGTNVVEFNLSDNEKVAEGLTELFNTQGRNFLGSNGLRSHPLKSFKVKTESDGSTSFKTVLVVTKSSLITSATQSLRKAILGIRYEFQSYRTVDQSVSGHNQFVSEVDISDYLNSIPEDIEIPIKINFCEAPAIKSRFNGVNEFAWDCFKLYMKKKGVDVGFNSVSFPVYKQKDNSIKKEDPVTLENLEKIEDWTVYCPEISGMPETHLITNLGIPNTILFDCEDLYSIKRVLSYGEGANTVFSNIGTMLSPGNIYSLIESIEIGFGILERSKIFTGKITDISTFSDYEEFGKSSKFILQQQAYMNGKSGDKNMSKNAVSLNLMGMQGSLSSIIVSTEKLPSTLPACLVKPFTHYSAPHPYSDHSRLKTENETPRFQSLKIIGDYGQEVVRLYVPKIVRVMDSVLNTSGLLKILKEDSDNHRVHSGMGIRIHAALLDRFNMNFSNSLDNPKGPIKLEYVSRDPGPTPMTLLSTNVAELFPINYSGLSRIAITNSKYKNVDITGVSVSAAKLTLFELATNLISKTSQLTKLKIYKINYENWKNIPRLPNLTLKETLDHLPEKLMEEIKSLAEQS